MKRKKLWSVLQRWGKYGICMAAGVFLYVAAELAAGLENPVQDGMIRRNDCGEGDASYEFTVGGLEEKPVSVSVTVPERRLSDEELKETVSKAVELLCERILGENASLTEVRTDLKLVRELPEYGLLVSWDSEEPEMISDMGILGDEIPEKGKIVYLKAEISNGSSVEQAEIPVTVLPPFKNMAQRFSEMLNRVVSEQPDRMLVPLPKEFEGHTLTYGTGTSSGNRILLLLGVVAAAVLYLKEKSDAEQARKRREDSLLRDYPELVSCFLVLTGAGYPVRQAWKKQVTDYEASENKGYHPVYKEMRAALNQMETGTPEVQAYGEFGRRTGLGCYMKLTSLLGSSIHTGGRDLRRLLEEELEAAFSQRKDIAVRKGEEASTKLLFPMFLMLGVVMVMIAAPAFLTLS